MKKLLITIALITSTILASAQIYKSEEFIHDCKLWKMETEIVIENSYIELYTPKGMVIRTYISRDTLINNKEERALLSHNSNGDIYIWKITDNRVLLIEKEDVLTIFLVCERESILVD